MRIYQVPVCIFCRKQADWRARDRMSYCFQCDNPEHGYKYLNEDQVKWIEVIPLREEDDDFAHDWKDK